MSIVLLRYMFVFTNVNDYWLILIKLKPTHVKYLNKVIVNVI